MQTVSPRWKLVRVDRLLLSINLVMLVAFNLSVYFWFITVSSDWIWTAWCLAGLLVFWVVLWTVLPRRMNQEASAGVFIKSGGTLLSLITIYSLLNGLSYQWLPDLEVYITVILQCFFTLIVGITMTLSLVDQSQAGSQINWPVVICSYFAVLVTFMLNLAGLWLMLTRGV